MLEFLMWFVIIVLITGFLYLSYNSIRNFFKGRNR